MISEDQKEKWNNIQLDMAQKYTEIDKIANLEEIDYIGGLFLIEDKNDSSRVICSISIIDFLNGQCVYTYSATYKANIPYLSGYVGFREVPIFADIYETLLIKKPEYSPDVLMINSYGKLHDRCAGCATQLALHLNMPVIGIGLTILKVDGIGERITREQFKKECKNEGDYIELIGESNTIYGAAVRTTKQSIHPIYVTVGSYISLNRAICIVLNCSKFRFPEPVRCAEKRCKDILMNNNNSYVIDLDNDDNNI